MSIRNKLYLSSAILLFASLGILFAVIQFVVMPQIQNDAIEKAHLTAQVIGEKISSDLQENAILTRSMAALASSLPLDKPAFVEHMSSLVESGVGIAGGGIWPEPNELIQNQQKASLFWAKKASNTFDLLDDYNSPQSSPYQKESWYTNAKKAHKGECVWSEIYVDPVSNMTMVTCSVKIERSGQFWGVATIDVDLSDIDNILIKEHEKMGTYGMIVDQTNQIISLPLLRTQNFTLVQLNQLGTKDHSLAPLATRLLNKDNSSTEIEKGVIPDDKSLAVTYTLPKQGWKIAILLPSNIALSEVHALTTTLYNALIGLIVIFILALLITGHRLIGTIKQTTTQVRSLAQGHTDAKLSVSGNDELTELAIAINNYGDHLTAILQRVKDEAEHVKNTATSMDELSGATQQRALKLMNENNTLATAIHQMSATASSVSEDIATVAEITTNSSRLVDSGFSLIEQNTESISELFSKLAESVTVIQQLSDDSQQVATVLDVIMNISEQTNLLALNAAIEAARAGDSGRGFAVVADEVRTLAHRTQQSAIEIENMIKQLQETSAKGVSVIDECQNHSETVNARSNASRGQYEKIVEAFNDIRERGNSIAVATEEQAAVTGNVEMLAERIRRISNQNVDDATEFRSVSSKASQQAIRLYELSRQ